MVSEETRRRSGFQDGMSIVLADGQAWTFPVFRGGHDESDSARSLDAQQRALLACIAEAESQTERLLAELALAIELLSRNYRLFPENYQDLLDFPAEGPELRAAQRAFRELAARVAGLYGEVDLPEVESERAGSRGSGILGRLVSRLRTGLSGPRAAGLVGTESGPGPCSAGG